MNPKPEGCGNPRCRNGSILDNAGFWMMICPTCSKPTVEPSPEGVGMPTTEQFAHEFNKLVRMNSASDGLEKAVLEDCEKCEVCCKTALWFRGGSGEYDSFFCEEHRAEDAKENNQNYSAYLPYKTGVAFATYRAAKEAK